MKILRTANAGILLEIDNVSILIDGICSDYKSYFGTPNFIKNQILSDLPDAVCFTHEHPDHYDNSFNDYYINKTGKSVIKPPFYDMVNVNGVNIRPVETRHIGKYDIKHFSFIIEGSKCVWFAGDVSPNSLNLMKNFPKPDILIVPFAYLNTDYAYNITKSFGAERIVVLHLPNGQKDEFDIFSTVKPFIDKDDSILVPKICEEIAF